MAVVFGFTVGLAVLAFPPSKAPEFAYAMLVPGIFWAYTRPRLKLYAWTMFAAQAVAWTFLLGWLHNVTWVGLFLLGPFVGAWVGSWYLAAWWAVPRLLGRPTLTRLAAMLGLASAWVIIEWTRSWLLGGFPWLPLAASQWERASILQIASFTGAYGVSFVLVMMNLGFAAYAHRLFREGAVGLNKRSQEFFLALFLLMAPLRASGGVQRFRYTCPWGGWLVQPTSADVKWDPAKGPGILDVLEKRRSPPRHQTGSIHEAVTPWAARRRHREGFIESLTRRAQACCCSAHCDRKSGNRRAVVQRRSSSRPTRASPPTTMQSGSWWRSGVCAAAPGARVDHEVIADGDDFRAADSSPLIVPLRGQPVVFGPLICYEDVYPQLARRSARAGPASRRADEQRLVRRGRRRLPARGAFGPARRRDAPPGAAMRQRRLERVDR